MLADAPHDFHRAVAAEQQQARGDAASERGRSIEAGVVAGRVERVAEQFLDAREIHDALAQHRLRDLAEVRIGFRARRRRAGRHDEAHEGVVEAVLDAYQRRRDADQRVLLGRRAARDDVGQARQLALDLLAHGAEAQHRERVADLLEQVHLRGELLGRAALARVEVERVLDAAEVLLDRGSHRAHEPHRRSRKRFTLLLDGLVERQQLAEPERNAHRVDAFAAVGRARDVEQEVVQELDRRRAGVGFLAQAVQALEFAVRVPEQALDGDARLEAAAAQRVDERAGHPPELVQGRGGRNALHSIRDVAERVEAALVALAANEPQQARLELRPQAPGPLRHRHLPVRRGRHSRGRGLLGAEVERQQRALGQERRAAHRAQVVEQRQQDQREVATAAQHPLEIRRQLHARAHQCVEAVHVLAGVGLAAGHPARGLLHLLGKERGAVHLDHAQHAARRAHELRRLADRRLVRGRLGGRFQRDANFVQRRGEFARDEMQCLLVDRGEARHG